MTSSSQFRRIGILPALAVVALGAAAWTGLWHLRAPTAAIRSRMISLGGISIATVFLAYLALGVGLLKTVDFVTGQHLPARMGALAAILFGLWRPKDFFLPDLRWRLQEPPQARSTARGWRKRPASPLWSRAASL